MPCVKGPAIVSVLPATVATPELTMTSEGTPSKVAVIIASTAIVLPLGGSTLTIFTGGTSSSMSSSAPAGSQRACKQHAKLL